VVSTSKTQAAVERSPPCTTRYPIATNRPSATACTLGKMQLHASLCVACSARGTACFAPSIFHARAASLSPKRSAKPSIINSLLCGLTKANLMEELPQLTTNTNDEAMEKLLSIIQHTGAAMGPALVKRFA